MVNFAYIQITRVCNQECRFCSNPPIDKIIPIKYAKSLIDTYIKNGYSGLILSGGEPTLYPHLEKLIAYATNKLFPVKLITNGQKTSDFKYLKLLVEAGLKHIILSIYSNKSDIQSFLTKNDNSLHSIIKTLENISKLNIRVDIITVINKYNASHLSEIIKWLIERYPFIHHFIWNNLDPFMNRASINKDTIPRLNSFELELYKSMLFLNNSGRTFRVERLPLCYMAEFAHCSTETRKIVKKQERTIYFLDKRGLQFQKNWRYNKTDCCHICSLNEICAGLYDGGKSYSFDEIYPLFISKEDVIKRILIDA